MPIGHWVEVRKFYPLLKKPCACVKAILNRGPRLQEITRLICWTTDAMKKYWCIAILFWLYAAKPMEESTRAKRMPCAQRLCSSSAEMLLQWIRSLQERLN